MASELGENLERPIVESPVIGRNRFRAGSATTGTVIESSPELYWRDERRVPTSVFSTKM